MQRKKPLENNQTLSKIALNVISQGVLITDPDQNILWANTAFESITGYHHTELENQNCRILQGPLSDPQTIMEISLALKNLTQFSGEILNYRKDTTIFWNELTITPVFDKQGQLSNFISTTRDITKRKQAQEALSLTQTRLNFAIECSEIGAWDFDLINNTTWRSVWHDQIFGYVIPPREWNAIIALRHVVREDRKRILVGIKQAFQTGKLFLECRIMQPDQSQRWINAKGHVIYNEQAQPIRILGTVVDVTAYKTVKIKEQEDLEKLAQVARIELMGEMASGIAHEVNQPLAAIANYAQAGIKLINTEKPDWVNLSEILFKTQQQSLRAGQIIHRMKEFGRLHTTPRIIPDINLLIHESTNFCNSELVNKNVRINFDLADHLPPLFIDQIQIQQVIINLISNSIEALQNLPKNRSPQIRISSCLTPKNDIQVSIKDNGRGIDEEQKLKIFTSFHTTKLNGTGMGLSISRSLIQAHSGTIYFNTALGKGSTFYFTLPTETAENNL